MVTTDHETLSNYIIFPNTFSTDTDNQRQKAEKSELLIGPAEKFWSHPRELVTASWGQDKSKRVNSY